MLNVNKAYLKQKWWAHEDSVTLARSPDLAPSTPIRLLSRHRVGLRSLFGHAGGSRSSPEINIEYLDIHGINT